MPATTARRCPTTYLVAEQQSKDMIDALSAARSALPTDSAPTATDNGKLYITGYSQGGYVAMATQRAMQAAGMTVSVCADVRPVRHGRFRRRGVRRTGRLGRDRVGRLAVHGLPEDVRQHLCEPGYVFEDQYATGIESLLPSTSPRSVLYTQGKLPRDALFSSTPPDASFASVTPATTPAGLAPVFALGFGSNNLVRNSFRLSYLLDAQANPDGGWPTTTTGVTAAAPAMRLRQARN